ncbi:MULTISPECIES: hypothetical protein [unclassified Mesorhizobium]|uniref:hypothetical protein n=1 Tax=unclassified Mesorhizobium TaxID=325217 RepID=UPI0015E3C056|nr:MULTISPECIES: hypothetical protein [unclassified Mesorhizobium]
MIILYKPQLMIFAAEDQCAKLLPDLCSFMAGAPTQRIENVDAKLLAISEDNAIFLR